MIRSDKSAELKLPDIFYIPYTLKLRGQGTYPSGNSPVTYQQIFTSSHSFCKQLLESSPLPTQLLLGFHGNESSCHDGTSEIKIKLPGISTLLFRVIFYLKCKCSALLYFHSTQSHSEVIISWEHCALWLIITYAFHVHATPHQLQIILLKFKLVC